METLPIIRIFLVDDHKLIRDGIRSYFDDDPFYHVVGEAVNGLEALNKIPPAKPHLVFADINMEVMNGVELAQKLKQQYPQIKLIALTMLNESQYVKQMMAAGASGYLLKNCGEIEIKRAIKAVMQGQIYYTQEVTQLVMESLAHQRARQRAKSVQEMPLTEREMEVLRLIVKEYANQEIADKLFISPRTVEAHKRNLLEKTGSKNIAGLTLYAVHNQLFDDI